VFSTLSCVYKQLEEILVSCQWFSYLKIHKCCWTKCTKTIFFWIVEN